MADSIGTFNFLALRGTPIWRDKDDLLQSVPGVGDALARSDRPLL